MFLTIADCSNRIAQAIELDGESAQDVVLAIIKAAVTMPFLEAIFMGDAGRHFLAECNELFEKLIGSSYKMSYTESHQSIAFLEEIHMEINRYLRPLLEVLWKVIDDHEKFM